MIILLLLVAVCCFSVESASESQDVGRKTNDAHSVFHSYMTPLSKMPNVTTYFEKGENLLRIPNLLKDYPISKKKKFKPTPKRTIQKIIKKNSRSRPRKIYLYQATNPPTNPPQQIYENVVQDEPAMNNNNDRDKHRDIPTTQATQKKKVRKTWNVRGRNPMPFQKLQTRKEMNTYKRNKRELGERELFILEKLDEAKFMRDKEGNNVVRTYVKRYW